MTVTDNVSVARISDLCEMIGKDIRTAGTESAYARLSAVMLVIERLQPEEKVWFFNLIARWANDNGEEV